MRLRGCFGLGSREKGRQTLPSYVPWDFQFNQQFSELLTTFLAAPTSNILLFVPLGTLILVRSFPWVFDLEVMVLITVQGTVLGW